MAGLQLLTLTDGGGGLRSPESNHVNLWDAGVGAGAPAVPRDSPGFAMVQGREAQFSRDGSRVAVLGAGGVRVLDVASGREVAAVQDDGVAMMHLSPRADQLLTFQKPKKKDNSEKNMKVWDLATGEVLWGQYQRVMARENWPPVQWSDDQTAFLRNVNNEVHIFDPSDYAAGIARRLRMKGVAEASISPGGEPLVAGYVPEGNGRPAHAQIYRLADLPARGEDPKAAPPTAVARRTFFKSSGVRFHWNSTATALLVTAYSDIDTTNQSYYGEQNLHFMRADGSIECLVPDLKEGPVHDVQWSPKGDLFVVVHGFMPAKATMFNDKCKPIYDFGSGPHNTVKWNPFGRFLFIGGFGNLPGDIQFYDKKADGKCKLMGKVRERDTVACHWAPDGRHVVTSTTAPRMRVENRFKVFRYNGEELSKTEIPVLYECEWRPAPADTFEDLPMSPGAAKAGALATAATAESNSGYIPPHLRKAGVTQAPRANFSLAYDLNESAPGKIRSGGAAFGAGRRGEIPGAGPAGPSKSASKNAKRRAKAKANKASGERQDMVAAGAEGASETADALARVTVGGAPEAAATAPPPGPEKKLRGLNKKIKQIEELKQKQAGGQELNAAQLEKLKAEPEVRSGIRELEAEIAG